MSLPLRKPFNWPIILEVLYCTILVAAAWHLVDERIDHRAFPHGDEGSWMAAAAELSHGNGFTTRWLEHGFLKPYALPRPDDYRYPGLVGILAAAFLMFGCSYSTALWTVGCLFLVFGLSVYGVARKAFGRRTAIAVLPLFYFSLLQLMYSTQVYTESLFGIGIAVLLGISCYLQPSSRAWWVLSGTCIGVLYLIRPNGILFAAALFFYALRAFFKSKTPKIYIVSGLTIMIAVMVPWLIRSWIVFGNPFHLAGSAGLLRASATDPGTYSILDFSRIYGSLYFIKAVLANITTYFSILHEQEHGLELVPLFFCLWGIFRRRPFFNGMVLSGFLLTFLACAYTSAMHSWAGNRYFSPLIPFVYAFGIHQIFRIIDAVFSRYNHLHKMVIAYAATVLVTGCLLLPVVYPHRYYERFYAKTPPSNKDYSAYYAALKNKLPEHPFYYAGSLAQINFATGLNCVGMQHAFDEKEILKAQRTFHPKLLALKPYEFDHPYFKRLMQTLNDNGYDLEKASEDSFAVIVDIKKPFFINSEDKVNR